MSGRIEVDADITASHDGHQIRIHGERNALFVDAGSWSPILRLRRLSGVAKLPLPDGVEIPVIVRIRVRDAAVCTIRVVRGRTIKSFHPLGILRSLIPRR